MNKRIYTSEDGVKELVELCKDGKIFSPIVSQEDLYIHNFIMKKINEVGFNESNMEEIISFTLSLKDIKKPTEEDEVLRNYFGDNPRE